MVGGAGVFKASFDPLRRVFFAASWYFGVQRFAARSRMWRDDRDRMRSRRRGREVARKRKKKTRHFQWMSEFLGCSSAELMTGAYVTVTSQWRRDIEVLNPGGDVRRKRRSSFPSLLFLILPRQGGSGAGCSPSHRALFRSYGVSENPQPSDSRRHRCGCTSFSENLSSGSRPSPVLQPWGARSALPRPGSVFLQLSGFKPLFHPIRALRQKVCGKQFFWGGVEDQRDERQTEVGSGAGEAA